MADAAALSAADRAVSRAACSSLKVFEARYLDLMSRCLREQRAVRRRRPARGQRGAQRGGEAVQLSSVGTLAELIDVDSAQAGILLVRCRGTRALRCVGATQQEPTACGSPTTTPIDDDRRGAARRALAARRARAWPTPSRRSRRRAPQPFLEPHRLDDAGWVANRWCEILPLPLEAKQRLMTLERSASRASRSSIR